MSVAVNSVVIAGNLTKDVDFRGTPSGKSVCTMLLAINEGNRENPETTFVEVRAWGKTAELCRQYLAKGSPVLIEGRLKLDQWEDRNTGSKRSKLAVVANRVNFIGGSRNSNGGNQPQYQQSRGVDPHDAPPMMPDPEVPEYNDGSSDDIPFEVLKNESRLEQ